MTILRYTVRGALAAAMLASVCIAAQAAGTVKIAYIDPLSGSFANVGEAGLKHFQAMADEINAKGGVLGKKIEIVVVPFDNKTSPQESLSQLKRVIDQDIRYVTQGNGSSVAGGHIDAVRRHHQR